MIIRPYKSKQGEKSSVDDMLQIILQKITDQDRVLDEMRENHLIECHYRSIQHTISLLMFFMLSSTLTIYWSYLVTLGLAPILESEAGPTSSLDLNKTLIGRQPKVVTVGFYFYK